MWLNGFAAVKDRQIDTSSNLREFMTISFDAWQQGQRSTEQKEALIKCVFRAVPLRRVAVSRTIHAGNVEGHRLERSAA